MPSFDADAKPLLIGSLPLEDHGQAVAEVLRHTLAIPSWPQLPVYPQEGMVVQFLPGFPGVKQADGKVFIDTDSDQFEAELLSFYESYLAASEDPTAEAAACFALNPEVSKGFFELLKQLKSGPAPLTAVKGQITGPFTFATGLTDQDGRAVFYNDQLRDAAVKLLALKARWQVAQLKQFQVPVIVFLDEPALAGFGSSEFISVSKEEVSACLREVAEAVTAEGALVGIHVCANTDWSVAFEAGFNIVNFDAHGYFDKFVLYEDQLKGFLQNGGILAWGIVPTLDAEAVEAETSDSLTESWLKKARIIEGLGFDAQLIRRQSLITPSCGMGSLSLDLARKVLSLTENVSDRIRNSYGQ
jgi:methionine synthase II (cobalamin-independent)